MSRSRSRSKTCVAMEGYLMTPPDRNTILNRAAWKSRYVVIGSAQGEVQGEGKGQGSNASDGITYLSLYKNIDDWEPAQQYATSNITHCTVQTVAHRKQGPALPTLILTIAADPTTEKLRKRRSSRAATLVTGKDNGPTTLWFRTDGEPWKLQEWARCIQGAMLFKFPDNMVMSPMTPLSPSFPSFNNPFGSLPSRDASDSYSRPPSAPKTCLHHKVSSSLYHTRERPVTISDAPSLRSRRSDLSSMNSSSAATAATMTTHSFNSFIPSDLPTPASTVEPFGGFIEGWTSAQGRSSMLGSPIRPVRDSAGSIPPFSPISPIDSGSPPLPNETILDRAFQRGLIPGLDQQAPGEEKLSSLARFEALMRQADAQRKQREKTERRSMRPVSNAQQLELGSAWDEDDDLDSDDSDAASDDTEGISEIGREEDIADDMDSARRQSRRTPSHLQGPVTPQQSPRIPRGPRPPVAYNAETLAALSRGGSPRERPSMPSRTHSHTPSGLGGFALGVAQPAMDVSPGKSSIMSAGTSNHDEAMSGLNPSSAYRTSTLAEGQQQQPQRYSATSRDGSKRLSFTDFTRRLSATSSMLLVQNNAAAHNSNGDGVNDQQGGSTRRSSVLQPRAGPTMYASPRSEVQDRAEKCGSWRSSMGMLGSEGGFL